MATELPFTRPLEIQARPRLTFLDKSYADELCALERRCYSHPWSEELIRGEFNKDVSVRLGLVLSTNTIVAYSFNYIVADELHILNLAVNPDFRSRGHGKRLLSEIIQFGTYGGAKYATLEVRQSNYVAKALYNSMGFEIVGLRKNYYRDNFENALVLELKMPPAAKQMNA